MKAGQLRSFASALAMAAVACVPSGSAPPYDAGAQATSSASTFRPSLNVMGAPFEDNFDRSDMETASDASTPPAGSASSSTVGPKHAEAGVDAAPTGDAGPLASILSAAPTAGDADHLPPSNLGPNWIEAKTSAWRVESGRLCGQGAKNHGVWLNRTLPVNARIEFDAVSLSDEGDLKAEVWGDGHSYATGTSYTNATSYLVILGGWHNTLHVIARLNEHGTDRQVLPVDPNSDDPRQRPVVKGQTYRFKIERTDGKTIRWSVDGVEYLKWTDPAPLAGEGHDHFGLNDWDAKVCFDNVKVTPL